MRFVKTALVRAMVVIFVAASGVCSAQIFRFPTDNRTLLEADGGGERFFVGTVGRPWMSGTFGCVRSEGWQMHEGIDIRCLKRDARGEPVDPIHAAAAGTVAYINHKQGLSNYGKYIVLKHNIEGIDIYTIYAHLSKVRDDLNIGLPVKSGEEIAIMGRTANTRQGISKDRAHLHFEINLYVNERFPEWYQKTFPGQRNDHGQWNGQNLLGLDPRVVFLDQAAQGKSFSLLQFVRNQNELCRVLVRDTSFPWLKRYTPLIRRNPVAEREGVAGYELALNYNGVPFQVIPRAPSEIKSSASRQLLSVNEAELAKHPCRKLVAKRGSGWELAAAGNRLLDLLTF